MSTNTLAIPCSRHDKIRCSATGCPGDRKGQGLQKFLGDDNAHSERSRYNRNTDKVGDENTASVAGSGREDAVVWNTWVVIDIGVLWSEKTKD
jgi:hypothetical protein